MVRFTSWKSRDNGSHYEFSRLEQVGLISLYDFLIDHNIAPGDFPSINDKFMELYTLCNKTILETAWDLKDGPLLQRWSGTIMSLGTPINLMVGESLSVKCFPALRLKMLRMEDRRRLVTMEDISKREFIGRHNIQIPVLFGS